MTLDMPHSRGAFFIDDPDVCYLDGNSLGRLPIAAAERINKLVVDGWGKELIGGWNSDWIQLPQRIGGKIATLIDAKPSEVIMADSTSVNLYKLAVAAVQTRRERMNIVTDVSNFPSDLYILKSAAESRAPRLEVRVVGQADQMAIPTECVTQAMDKDTALVCLSHVSFRSGHLADMHAITRAAHEVGALVLWDLSHSVGAVPIELNTCEVDLAVGCTYKYLCGGPGAPSFLFVREGLLSELENPIAGWFSHRSPFQFDANYDPAESVEKFLTGTPPVLSLAAIEAGVDLVNEAGISNLRSRSIMLSTRLIELYDRHLSELGFELRSPRDPSERGSHVSLGHPEARRITANLIARHHVIPDFRTPDNVRLGIAPLYTTVVEIERAVAAMVKTVRDREFETVALDDSPVT